MRGFSPRNHGAPVGELLSDLLARGLNFSMPRGVGSGLAAAERQLREFIGGRRIPMLLSSMANAVSRKSIMKGVAVA